MPAAVYVVSIDPQASTVWWANRITDLPFDFSQEHETPENLAILKDSDTLRHVFIDTPGSLQDENLLLEALKYAHDVIVPMPPEGLAFDPTARTISKVIEPTGLPFTVVVNNWDPRDGKIDRDETIEYIDAEGWPRASTVIRRYKVHTRASVEGKVVTQYDPNRASLQAREDFYRLAIELGYGGGK